MKNDPNVERLTVFIEDGSYYKNARDWYFDKFCRPLSERVIWFIIAIFFVYFSINIINQIRAWYPLKIDRPIIIYNDNAEFKQVVTKMENPYRNPDYAILRYLVKNYVEMREEFLKGSLSILDIDHRLKRISNNSTREVAREYQRNFDYGDARNPLKRLGSHGVRRVDVLDVRLNIEELSLLDRAKRFNKYIELPKSAIVNYIVREETLSYKLEEQWRVNISFNYSGVIIDTENNSLTLTDFTVTNYQQQKIR